jgi:hypothetical protein
MIIHEKDEKWEILPFKNGLLASAYNCHSNHKEFFIAIYYILCYTT